MISSARRLGSRKARFLGLALLSAPLPALAQPIDSDAGAGAPVAGGPDVIADGEILVTARRRAERLQDVPVSITAFDESALVRSGSTSVADIALRTPSLQYGDFGDVKLSPTSLRGVVGSASSAGADPAIGYYVDEVFVGQGAGANLDLYDIERIEVIRGPQGVLFGRNTIGGVVSLTTKRPTEDFEGSLLAEFGNYDYRRTGLSLSGALVPGTVLAKIAATHEIRDGTSRNVALGTDANSREAWGVRGQLLFTLAPSTELLLTADHNAVEQSPLGLETLRYNESSSVVALLAAAGLPRNANPTDRQVYGDIDNFEDLSAWGVAATLRTEIGETTLVNIASYRSHDYRNRSDTDRTALSLSYDGDPEDVWRFSNELRAEFRTGAIDWTTGLYFFRQHSNNQSFVDIGKDLANLLGSSSLTGLRLGSRAKLDTTSYAAFANATVPLSNTLDISLGGRYTRDEKEIDFVQTDSLGFLGGSTAVRADDAWEQFTPAFNIRYRPDDSTLVYATVSKGYKSGGFNDALGDADGIAFDPETLWNYEAGFKASLFDRRLTANASVYYMDWKSIQLAQDDPRTSVFDPIILNAGKAHSTGIELELSARPAKGLTLGFAGSLQEAEFDRGTLPNGTPLAQIPFAPKYTANINAEQRVPFWRGELVAYGEYLRRGRTYLTNEQNSDSRQNAFGLVNLRLGYEPDESNWRVSAWVRNLANIDYKTRVNDLSAQPFVGQVLTQLGDPRTYGVDLRLNF